MELFACVLFDYLKGAELGMVSEDARDVVVEQQLLVVTHRGTLASGGLLRCLGVSVETSHSKVKEPLEKGTSSRRRLVMAVL